MAKADDKKIKKAMDDISDALTATVKQTEAMQKLVDAQSEANAESLKKLATSAAKLEASVKDLVSDVKSVAKTKFDA